MRLAYGMSRFRGPYAFEMPRSLPSWLADIMPPMAGGRFLTPIRCMKLTLR